MKLDNEEQRKMLLLLIEAAPVRGTYAEVKPIMAKLEAMRVTLHEAGIEEIKTDKEVS